MSDPGFTIKANKATNTHVCVPYFKMRNHIFTSLKQVKGSQCQGQGQSHLQMCGQLAPSFSTTSPGFTMKQTTKSQIYTQYVYFKHATTHLHQASMYTHINNCERDYIIAGETEM